jgi:hypothetical protein
VTRAAQLHFGISSFELLAPHLTALSFKPLPIIPRPLPFCLRSPPSWPVSGPLAPERESIGQPASASLPLAFALALSRACPPAGGSLACPPLLEARRSADSVPLSNRASRAADCLCVCRAERCGEREARAARGRASTAWSDPLRGFSPGHVPLCTRARCESVAHSDRRRQLRALVDQNRHNPSHELLPAHAAIRCQCRQ